jgi:hypothetical protein
MTNSAVALARRLGRVRQLAPDANGIFVLPGSHSGDDCVERWLLVPVPACSALGPATCVAALSATVGLASAHGRSSALVCCASTADFEPRDAITPQT